MGPESAAMLGEGTAKVGGVVSFLKDALDADITLLWAHRAISEEGQPV